MLLNIQLACGFLFSLLLSLVFVLEKTFTDAFVKKLVTFVVRLSHSRLNCFYILSASPTDRGLVLLCGVYQLGIGDVTGVNIIAFRRFSQMDISGNVVVNTSTDHINTLKVFFDFLRYTIVYL